MLKLYKKQSLYPFFITFFLNNKHFFFSKIWIKGPLGKKNFYIPNEINFFFKNFYFFLITGLKKNILTVFFSLLKNTIQGVSSGFKKYLRIRGLGFKVIKENKFLIFFLGYSHKIQFNLIENFEFLILGTKNRILKLFCLDLVKLNQITFLIQLLRTPGIYKYKGIYFDRKISLLKAGKKKKFR